MKAFFVLAAASFLLITSCGFLTDSLSHDFSDVTGTSTNDGLIGKWLFDGNADDTSGNNHDGTVYGAVLDSGYDGRSNSAYYFDGTTDYIDFSGELLDSDDMSFAFSFWLYSNDPSGIMFCMRSENSWGQKFIAGLSADEGVSFGWNETGNATTVGATSLSEGAVFLTGRWNHYVLQSNDDGNQSIYLDGLLVASNDNTEKADVSSAPLTIGQWNNPVAGSDFCAIIDNLRVYDRTLSEDEISILYSGLYDNLLAEYRFSGNADDTSGNNHDGTVRGSASLVPDRNGYIASAYDFEDSGDYITVPVSIGSEYSISLWVKCREGGPVFGGSNYTYSSLITISGDSNDIGFSTTSAESWLYVDASSYIDDWIHIVAVSDYDSRRKYVYANGVLLGSLSAGTPATDTLYEIGGGDLSVDDILIYDRVLSADEVRMLYNAD